MYQFPKHYADDIGPAKVLLMREEKRKMRNIIRVLIAWGMNKKSEG
jgi:hypothetical protein